MNRHERRKQSSRTRHEDAGRIQGTFARAVELHRAGDLAAAEELYKRVVEWSPDSPEPWNYLGAVALARGDMPKAEQRYARALALRPDWAEVLNAHGSALHALGRHEEALRELRRATEVEPAHHAAWNSLGICLQRKGELVEALACFERASGLAPRTPAYLFNLGFGLKLLQRFDEACAAFAQALEARGQYPEALAQIAHCRRLAGEDEEAARCYRKYLESTSEDLAGARLYLAARAGGATVPDPSPAYVRHLFDEYAETFDAHLQQQLGYRVPELLATAVVAVLGEGRGALDVLDLGCGTGLSGEPFARRARRLVGVDLSPGMLRHALQRRIYHEILQGDALEYLKQSRESFDLVLAADVFNYVGKLGPVFAALGPRLRAGGVLAFSVEAGAAGVALQTSLRFVHGEEYLREELARAGLEVASLASETLRKQGDRPVEGRIVVARRPASPA